MAEDDSADDVGAREATSPDDGARNGIAPGAEPEAAGRVMQPSGFPAPARAEFQPRSSSVRISRTHRASALGFLEMAHDNEQLRDDEYRDRVAMVHDASFREEIQAACAHLGPLPPELRSPQRIHWWRHGTAAAALIVVTAGATAALDSDDGVPAEVLDGHEARISQLEQELTEQSDVIERQQGRLDEQGALVEQLRTELRTEQQESSTFERLLEELQRLGPVEEPASQLGGPTRLSPEAAEGPVAAERAGAAPRSFGLPAPAAAAAPGRIQLRTP